VKRPVNLAEENRLPRIFSGFFIMPQICDTHSGGAEDTQTLRCVTGPLDCDVLGQAVPEEEIDCLPLKIIIP
jgi:hypothetical protein